MFKQLAYVVSFSLLCSLFVALTLIPMLSGRILRVSKSSNPHGKTRRNKFQDLIKNFFSRIENNYKAFLHYALNHRILVLGITVAILAGSIALVRLVGSEFLPSTDEGEVRVTVEMEVGTKTFST